MGTLRIKRGTTSARTGFTPAEAELIYDTNTKEVYVGDGSTAGGIAVSVSTQNLENLGNVQSVTPQKDQILVYNGSNWAATDNPQLDLRGNIYADDSTLLVDAINGKIVGPVQTSSVIATTLTGTLTGDTVGSHTGSVVGNVVGTVTGDVKGSVFADDSTIMVDANNNVLLAGTVEATTINASTVNSALFQGNFKGTLVADDSSAFIDGINRTVNAKSITADKISSQFGSQILVQNPNVSTLDLEVNATNVNMFRGVTTQLSSLTIYSQDHSAGFPKTALNVTNTGNDAISNEIGLLKARGTNANLLTAQAGDSAGSVSWSGHDGSSAQVGATMSGSIVSISSNNIAVKLQWKVRNGLIGTFGVKAELSETGTYKVDKIESLTTNTDLDISANGSGAVNISDVIVKLPNLPTSDPGVAGQLWRSGNDVKISTG
tara:strand:- start:308 stop:1606 length:1299 start_codon:yes stop_codon:yes gene_type:complete